MSRELFILGAGESGVGAALLAKAKGYNVFVSDHGAISHDYREELEQAGIEFEEGGHSTKRALAAAEILKSPGIPDSAPLIQTLRESRAAIISDIEFACRFSEAHVIGITGSNGKTTTTLWAHHLLKNAGIDAVLAGNVGISPCRELVKRDPPVFVMEISSFQLDYMSKARVNTAVITNITPDHLDRYNYKFENYINSKFRLLQNQRDTDSFIWCADDPVLKEIVAHGITAAKVLPFSLHNQNHAAYVNEAGEVVINTRDAPCSLPLEMVSLKGKHNIYNGLAASLAALEAGAPASTILSGLTTFKGVEHRLEPAGKVNGVYYINDSKATNVNSTWFALESMNNPVIWIAGGIDKGNDYSLLTSLARTKVKALVCLGVDNSKLVSAFKGVIPEIRETSDMKKAVETAAEIAKPGDVVLLSPACASFDLFKNYEHRGQLFKKVIGEI